MYGTLDADGMAPSSGRKVQQMIADKMELSDTIGWDKLQGFDHVDLVVGQAQTTDTAHIGEHTGTDRTQIALLYTQQLLF